MISKHDGVSASLLPLRGWSHLCFASDPLSPAALYRQDFLVHPVKHWDILKQAKENSIHTLPNRHI
jgi:hypothetical protein